MYFLTQPFQLERARELDKNDNLKDFKLYIQKILIMLSYSSILFTQLLLKLNSYTVSP